jgi:hypothetical protein
MDYSLPGNNVLKDHSQPPNPDEKKEEEVLKSMPEQFRNPQSFCDV